MNSVWKEDIPSQPEDLEGRRLNSCLSSLTGHDSLIKTSKNKVGTLERRGHQAKKEDFNPCTIKFLFPQLIIFQFVESPGLI